MTGAGRICFPSRHAEALPRSAVLRRGGSLFLKPCRDLYGHLGAAFYGLGTVMSTPVYAGLISDPPGRTADLGADSLQ